MLDRQASMDIIILKRRRWVIITFKADTDLRKITPLVGMFINWHDETYQIKVDVTKTQEIERKNGSVSIQLDWD